MKNKKEESGGVGLGAGIVAGAAALAAGYYFYVSKDAKKNRQIIVEWATSLKDDVTEKISSIGDSINQESVMGVIDEVAKIYYTTKGVAKEDVMQAVQELKNNWQELTKGVKGAKATPKLKGKTKK